jgi:cytochrome c-type biogenesis protein CcmH
MTIFWILAAGLAILAALFVVAPLLGTRNSAGDDTPDADIDQARVNLELFKQQLAELDADLASGKLDQTEYAAARHDLEREVLRDTADLASADAAEEAQASGAAGAKGDTDLAKPWLPGPGFTAAALLFALPASALVLYLALGERQIIPRLEATAGAEVASPGDAPAGMPSLEQLVMRLEERLEQVPDDAEGWTMLGRTYFAMGRLEQAKQALARAHELLPDDHAVTLAYAESLAASNNSNLSGRPAELISTVLAAEPENVTARWLSGMVAFQQGQFQGAIAAWKGVLREIDPAGEEAAPDPSAVETPPQPAAASPGIDVEVSLDPLLAGRFPPGTTVFVYARAAAGPPMPLAVQRLTLADLPARVRLDDGMAMMPQMRLSNFPQVIVGARVSPSGQAIPRPGDLEGQTGPTAASGAVSVNINGVRP